MIVTIKNVSKTYSTEGEDRLQVLSNFSCSIAEGEFLCILGPSGCGKSTLLTILGGLQKPSDGRVLFKGQRTASGPLTTVVWQEYALIPWRTVLDNVAFGLEIRGVDKKTRREEAHRCLVSMGIAAFEDRYPHQLSGGMRQRVGIARALANDPEILLMDEPFAAVDAQTRRILQEELINLWIKDAKTVLFVTHSIEEAILLGDRILVLSHRPAQLLEEFVVPFPRPRSVEIERDPRFTEMRFAIWELLKREAQTSSVAYHEEGLE